MKVALVDTVKKKEGEKLLSAAGFSVVSCNPDMVVSYGGDGTIMRAEQKFPGVPILPLRASMVCKLCPDISNEEILSRVKNGKFAVSEMWKIQASTKGVTLDGMNDVIVHNADPRHAIRYTIFVNNKPMGGEIIGDGMVIATPFGSTGYYRSITDSYFEVGIGVAFNNSTEQSDHIVLDENSVIGISVLRGQAIVYVDNRKETIFLGENDIVEIRKSDKIARVVVLLD